METYEERTAREELEARHKDEADALQGYTPAVKKLKGLASLAGDWSNGFQIQSGGSMTYDPKGAKRATALEEIRKDLTSNPAEFFGTLDHRVVRKAYELEALNDRQRRMITAQYPWMVDEAQDEEIPALEKDEWYEPLVASFERLSTEEQARLSPSERMTIVSFAELKGEAEQPRFINRSNGEYVVGKSIMTY